MILVTGASGNVGRHVAARLRDADREVRLLTRDPTGLEPQAGAEVVAGDLARPESLRPALQGVDKVFLLLTLLPGVTDFDAIATEIAKAGVRHVVLLSSVTALSGPENAIGELNRRAERAIESVGLDWTFLRAGAFTSNALAWAPSIRTHGKVTAPFGHFVSSPVDPRDVAAVATQALVSPGHEGRAHVLSGPEALSITDQVAVLAEVIGREIEFGELGEDRARAMLTKTNPPNDHLVNSLLRMQKNSDSYLNQIHPTVRDVTGRPPITFRRWAVDHADAFH